MILPRLVSWRSWCMLTEKAAIYTYSWVGPNKVLCWGRPSPSGCYLSRTPIISKQRTCQMKASELISHQGWICMAGQPSRYPPIRRRNPGTRLSLSSRNTAPEPDPTMPCDSGCAVSYNLFASLQLPTCLFHQLLVARWKETARSLGLVYGRWLCWPLLQPRWTMKQKQN